MTKEEPPILLEKKDGVAKITINRPEIRNPLSFGVGEAIMSALEEIRNDDTIRVITTTGAGDKSFTAGMSVHDLKYLSERPPVLVDFHRTLFAKIRDFPKVTIAVVNGYVLGAGITFLYSHDLAIASEENARFGLPEIFRGFVAKQAPVPLFRDTHMKWAFEMLLTGKNWDAQRAYQAGLVNRVVPHAQLQEAAHEWAKEIAQLDPITLEYCKRAVHALVDEPTYDQAVGILAYWHEMCHIKNPEAYQGLRDFVAGKGVKATE